MPSIKRYRNPGFLARQQPGDKPKFFPDDEVRGLVAILNPTGKWAWAVRADVWVNGKRVKTTRRVIGTYPEMSQETARDAARRELKLIKKVLPEDDPSQWDVAQAFAAHIARGVGYKHKKDLLGYLRTHLSGLAETRLRDLKRKSIAELHDQLTRDGKKPTADKVTKALGAVYNTALRRSEEGTLPPNPVPVAVEFHNLPPGEQKDITDLRLWFKQLAAIPNRGRRLMFEFGLYAGLRPGLLRTLRREWFEADTLVVPRSEMGKAKKRAGSYRIPLTPTMKRIVEEATAYAQAVDPSSPYLFPGPRRGQPWSEKPEPSLITGKPLRRAHFQIAIQQGVMWHIAEMLADRSMPTAGRFYIGDPEKAKRDAQQQITNYLDGLRAPS